VTRGVVKSSRLGPHKGGSHRGASAVDVWAPTIYGPADDGLHEAVHVGAPHDGVLHEQVGCHLALCHHAGPAWMVAANVVCTHTMPAQQHVLHPMLTAPGKVNSRHAALVTPPPEVQVKLVAVRRGGVGLGLNEVTQARHKLHAVLQLLILEGLGGHGHGGAVKLGLRVCVCREAVGAEGTRDRRNWAAAGAGATGAAAAGATGAGAAVAAAAAAAAAPPPLPTAPSVHPSLTLRQWPSATALCPVGDPS